MLKGKKLTLALLVLSFVFSFNLSKVLAQQGCTFSTLQDDWQYSADWCGEISISGPATVNPGTDWVGTIAAANPYATCSVSSNSGCSLGCYVSADGTEVIAPVGPNHCGSFTVTVTQPASGGCPELTASKAVRINNTGQGGSWQAYPDGNGSCCSSTTGHCSCNGVGGIPIGCTIGQYKYTGVGNPGTVCLCVNEPWCCTSPLTTRPCGTTCENPCGQTCAETCPSVSCNIPPGTWTGECGMQWTAQEWKCTTCE
jgi:hypothetical protein